jgi:hypothetical protein
VFALKKAHPDPVTISRRGQSNDRSWRIRYGPLCSLLLRDPASRCRADFFEIHEGCATHPKRSLLSNCMRFLLCKFV